MKRLKPIMIATALIFGSSSVVAQTAEELFEQAENLGVKLSEEFSEYLKKDMSNSDSVKFYRKQFSTKEDQIKLYEAALEKGHPQAKRALLEQKWDLGLSYTSNKASNCIRAKALLNEVIEQTDTDLVDLKAKGLYSLASMFERGICIRIDTDKAFELYGKSCDLGNDRACRRYAQIKSKLSSK